MEDQGLRELALKIYARHKDALEFLFESRPGGEDNLLNVIRPSLDAREDLVPDRPTGMMLRFAPNNWANFPALNACPREQWTKSRRNVSFEIKSFKSEANNFSDRISLALILGPSEENLRRFLFDRIKKEPNVFIRAGNAIGQDWVTVYRRELITKGESEKLTTEQKNTTLLERWESFLSTDLPRLTEAMARIAAEVPIAGPD